MLLTEPNATALVMLVFGALAILSVLLASPSGRFGLPIVLLFLGIGILAGSEGIGGIPFEDYRLSFRVGTIALALILFDGGLNTHTRVLTQSIGPAGVLATLGVAATALLLAVGARLLGFSWGEALLLGAVVSSTDAAAVFSVLRGGGLSLEQRVARTLEIESGLNDPVAVILTMVLTTNLLSPQSPGLGTLLGVLIQIIVGAAVGIGLGLLGAHTLRHVRIPAAGLYPVFSIALACASFGSATLLQGSGFLAVYITGVVLGNTRVPYRTGLLRVHDGAAWLGQVTMFLLLGLLAFPSRLADVAWAGLGLAVMLVLVARPLAVFACLLPFRYNVREMVFISWVGLRGAVPVVLATFPVLAGAPRAHRIFDIVFFVVVSSALVQGGSARWLARKLGLLSHELPPPAGRVEFTSTEVLDGEILSFAILPDLPVAGKALKEIDFPPGAAAMLVIRGRMLIAPKGQTVLEPRDHVYVFCRLQDRARMAHIFGTKPD